MANILIWPDIYREQGHWLPCINLARSLQTAQPTGHSVKFMGIPDCESIVRPYAPTQFSNFFTTILSDIYPRGHSVENKLEPRDQRWKPAHVLPICRGALDSVFSGAGAPNLLVSGYFTALETLLIHYKYNQLPFVIVTTFLRHPDDLPSVHAKTKLLYMPQAVAQKIINLVTNDSGMDIDEFVAPLDKRLEISGQPPRPEIIPCPREFDFFDEDWDHDQHPQSNAVYVEPMITRQTLDGSAAPLDPVPDVPAGTRLIYATSGSQVQDYEFQARSFFKNLIAMMQTQGMENSLLVLAVGEKIYSQFVVEYGIDLVNNDPTRSTLPPNVKLFPWVSQLEILKRADVVFMHGGLATIKESVWEEVPIVIVPHGKDQMDNAQRIRRNGLGIVSEVADLSPLQLRELLTKATTSTWIKQKLAKMKAIFQAREAASPKPSVQIINGELP